MKPTVHLIHGFNVWDGGRGSIQKLKPYFEAAGYQVAVHDYGWTGLLGLRWRNDKAAAMILEQFEDGDILAMHSNGNLIGWHITEAGRKPGAIVCLQAALRRDTEWPMKVPVLNLWNPDDWVVTLGRWWGRFWSVANPFRKRHGWGAAGRHGFDEVNTLSAQWDTSVEPYPALGHGGIFEQPALEWWGVCITQWLKLNTRTDR